MEERNVQDVEYDNFIEKMNQSETHVKRRMDFDDGGKVVNWLERIVALIHNYGMKRIIQALLLIASIVFFVMFVNAIDNQQIIDKFIANTTEQHDMGSNIRKDITPKISKTLIKMLYSMGGDRVSILEMHNGKENPTALPFVYCDMTYEETKDRIPYVAEEYEDLNMSKFNFPSYLYEHRYFIGSIEEIYTIDKKLAMRLDMNGVKYAGIILIHTNVDIGFLMISYLSEPTVSRETIFANLSYYVQEIGTYLDYGKQLEELKENKKDFKLWLDFGIK